MFTQAMPAFVNAQRNGGIFPAMQALGNCQQPLTHRGGINIAPASAPNNRGVYTSQPWNPNQYQRPESPQGVDVAGMTTIWNSGNRYDSQFYFPTDQYFTQNQFFGGPQIHVGGGFETDSLAAQEGVIGNVIVQNITTPAINGEPVAPLPGPPGAAGREGRAGVPGFPGRPGRMPRGEFRELRFLKENAAGVAPRVGIIPQPVAENHRYVANAWLSPFVPVNVPTNAISGGSVSIDAVSVVVPTAVTFDPGTQTVTFSATTTVYALTNASVTFTGTAANTVAVIAATTAGTILASNDFLDAGGILIKGEDADFWEDTVSVTVARNAVLEGIGVDTRTVFHKLP